MFNLSALPRLFIALTLMMTAAYAPNGETLGPSTAVQAPQTLQPSPGQGAAPVTSTDPTLNTNLNTVHEVTAIALSPSSNANEPAQAIPHEAVHADKEPPAPSTSVPDPPEPTLTSSQWHSLKYAYFMPLFGQLGSNFAWSLQVVVTSNPNFCVVGEQFHQNALNKIIAGEKTIASILPSGFRGDEIGTWMGAKDYGTIDVIGNSHEMIPGGENGHLCEAAVFTLNDGRSSPIASMPDTSPQACSLFGGANKYQAHLNVTAADGNDVQFTLDANTYLVPTNGKFMAGLAKIPVSLSLNAKFCNLYYPAWCGIDFGPANGTLNVFHAPPLKNTAPCE